MANQRYDDMIIRSSIEADGYKAGAEAMAKANERIVNSSEKVDTTMKKTEQSVESTGRGMLRSRAQFDRLVSSIDPVYKAQTNLSRGQSLLDNAFVNGEITLSRKNELLDKLRQAYGNASGAIDKTTKSMKLSRQELFAIQYTTNDVIASLASGISPLTILLQQGGNFTQAFGGVGEAFRKIVTPARAFGLSVAATVATLGILAFKANGVESSLRSFEVRLLATGRAGETSRDSLKQLLDTTTAMTGYNRTSAVESIQILTSQTKVGSENWKILTELASNYAAVTGTDIPSAMSVLVNGSRNVKNFAAEMHDRWGVLTEDQYKHIASLDKVGKSTEAYKIILKAMSEQFDGMREKSMTPFGKAFDDLSRSWSKLVGQIKESRLALMALQAATGAVDFLTPSEKKSTVEYLAGGPTNQKSVPEKIEYSKNSVSLKNEDVHGYLESLGFSKGTASNGNKNFDSKTIDEQIRKSEEEANARKRAVDSIREHVLALEEDAKKQEVGEKQAFINNELLKSHRDLLKLTTADQKKYTEELTRNASAAFDTAKALERASAARKAERNIQEHLNAIEEDTEKLYLNNEQIFISNGLLKSHADLMKLDADARSKAEAELTTALKDQYGAKQKRDEIAEMQKAVVDFGQSAASSLAEAFVDGSSALESFRSLFRSLLVEMSKRIIINMAVNAGADQASSFLTSALGTFFGGGKASGGTVYPGHYYEVGENGREIFTPNTSGQISSRTSSSANMNFNFNVEVSGTAAGNPKTAASSGEAFALAAKSKIIEIIQNEKRPGGSLWAPA